MFAEGEKKWTTDSASWSHGQGSPLLSGVVLEAMGGPKAARDSAFLEAVQSSVASKQKVFEMDMFVD
jgi:hypothetical protein